MKFAPDKESKLLMALDDFSISVSFVPDAMVIGPGYSLNALTIGTPSVVEFRYAMV